MGIEDQFMGLPVPVRVPYNPYSPSSRYQFTLFLLVIHASQPKYSRLYFSCHMLPRGAERGIVRVHIEIIRYLALCAQQLGDTAVRHRRCLTTLQ